MGEYADDLIAEGYEEYPSGQRKFKKYYLKQAKSMPLQKKIEPPEKVDDDHFTWWFDEMMSNPCNEKLSYYEVALLAWNEAVERCMKEINKGKV